MLTKKFDIICKTVYNVTMWKNPQKHTGGLFKWAKRKD